MGSERAQYGVGRGQQGPRRGMPSVRGGMDNGTTKGMSYAGITSSEKLSDREQRMMNEQIDYDNRNDPNRGIEVDDIPDQLPQDTLGDKPINENDLPGRRCTATLAAPPQMTIKLTYNDYITALQETGLDVDNDIACLQRSVNNQVHITFRSVQKRDLFLKHREIPARGCNLSTYDTNRNTHWVTIEDAPFELPDEAIMQRLKRHGRVLSHKRGKFKEHPNISNGMRHYRMRITYPIPSYLRFGNYYVRFRYMTQTPTCRKCGEFGHYGKGCYKLVCYNCDELGHIASVCPEEKRCSICKSEEHLARNCEYTWEWNQTADDEMSSADEEDPPESFLDGQESKADEHETDIIPGTEDKFVSSKDEADWDGVPTKINVPYEIPDPPETQTTPATQEITQPADVIAPTETSTTSAAPEMPKETTAVPPKVNQVNPNLKPSPDKDSDIAKKQPAMDIPIDNTFKTSGKRSADTTTDTGEGSTTKPKGQRPARHKKNKKSPGNVENI